MLSFKSSNSLPTFFGLTCCSTGDYSSFKSGSPIWTFRPVFDLCLSVFYGSVEVCL